MADDPLTRKRLVTVVMPVTSLFALERATRIELAFSAWEADVLPLNYARVVHLEPSKRPAQRVLLSA